MNAKTLDRRRNRPAGFSNSHAFDKGQHLGGDVLFETGSRGDGGETEHGLTPNRASRRHHNPTLLAVSTFEQNVFHNSPGCVMGGARTRDIAAMAPGWKSEEM
jgi:hypothetical protein